MDRRNIPYGARNGPERRGTVSSVTVLLPEEVDEYIPTIVFNGYEGLESYVHVDHGDKLAQLPGEFLDDYLADYFGLDQRDQGGDDRGFRLHLVREFGLGFYHELLHEVWILFIFLRQHMSLGIQA